MENLDVNQLARYFKALSSPQRLKLFLMVCNSIKGLEPEFDASLQSNPNSCSCKGLSKAFTKACEYLNLSRSTISHHFSVLENAGLITCTRNGQKYICKVSDKAIKKIKHFV